jgi:pimeloyl-ACP methyl ester carboxylesterase
LPPRRPSAIERTVEANGLAHHVIEWDGGGETVVLCHGFLDLAWSFAALAQALADRGLRVLAFDWRGHGETEWVGRGGYYHFPDYVLDLHCLLRALELDRVHLVGHSMGGTACAYYAGTEPERLSSLALLEGLGPPDMAAADAPKRFAAFVRGAAEARAKSARVMTSIDEAAERLRAPHGTVPFEIVREIARYAVKPSGDGFAWRFDPLHRTSAPVPFRREMFDPFLAAIRARTLLVFGENGFRLGDEGERAGRIARHRIVELPGVGHMMHWLAPEALASVLADFFADGGA